MKTAPAANGSHKASRQNGFSLQTLPSLNTEEFCVEYLEVVRWPHGLTCIREGCGSRRIMSFSAKGKTGKTRRLYECVDCRYQYSVTTGTMFHNSHVPLSKWFLAINMISSANRRVSARDIERTLKVNYRTAGYLLRRIRLAIQQATR